MKKIINFSVILLLSLTSCGINNQKVNLVTLHLNDGKINGNTTLVLSHEEFKNLNEYPKCEGYVFSSYYLDQYFNKRYEGIIDENKSIDLYAKYTEDIFEYEIVNEEIIVKDLDDNALIRNEIKVPDYIFEHKVTTLASESLSNIETNLLHLDSIENIEIDSFKDSKIRYIKIGDDIKNIEYGAFRNINYLYNVSIEDNPYYSATNNVVLKKEDGNNRIVIAYYNEYWESMFSDQYVEAINIVGIAPYSFNKIYVEEDYEAVRDEETDEVIRDEVTGEIVYRPLPDGFSLYVPSKITKLSERAFENCKVYRFNEKNEEISIQLGTYFFSTLKEIGEYAFSNSSLTLVKYETKIENNVIVPHGEGVETFKKGAFQNTNIVNFTLPKSIKTIEEDCFKGCNNLEVIYYEGTEEEFNSINIALGNEALLNAKIFYFSIEPTENGWYYDDNNHQTPPKPVLYNNNV